MPSLNDLSALKDEQLEESQLESLDALHETGAFTAMLQPGVYELKLPDNLASITWEPVEAEGQPQRIKVKFDDQHPLVILSGGPDPSRIGEAINQSISNVPRERKMGGEQVKINDFLYLLKKLGEKSVPKTNKEYLLALSRHAGKVIRTAVSVSWNCNSKRNIYRWVPDPDPAKAAAGAGQAVEVPGQLGCGEKYYPDARQNGVPKQADGKYPERIICQKCAALIRGFSNLDLVREA